MNQDLIASGHPPDDRRIDFIRFFSLPPALRPAAGSWYSNAKIDSSELHSL
jgi:hypothetical protein